MPYETTDQLPQKIKKVLPKKAQEIFMNAFNWAWNKGHGEDTCFKIAWAVVKEKYKKDKKTGKWILKAKFKKAKKKKAKSSLARDVYQLDFVLATPEIDEDKEMFHKNFLEFISQRLKGLKGDVEHANLLKLDLPKDWIAEIVDAKPINGEIYASAVLNPNHPYFDTVWELAKSGQLGASIELEYDDTDYYINNFGYRIFVDGKPIGFAFTINPKKKGAKVYRAIHKKGEVM